MAEPTDGTAQEQPANDSIRDAVTAALTEHGTPGEEPKPEPKVKPDPKPEVEAEADTGAAELEPEAPARVRGPDGKFIKAEGAEEKPEVEAKSETEKPEGEVEPIVEPKALELPANWSAADRTAFKALPPEGQKVLKSMIDRQEADYTKKTQAVAALKSEYEPVDKMFAPYREQMQAKGFTPKGIIEAWANVEKRLVEGDGHNVIAGLVKNYNIPIERIAEALGVRSQRQADPDPALEQPQQNGVVLPPEVLQELRSLRDRQDAIDRDRQDGVRRSQLEREQSAEAKIQSFKSAVDEKGVLLHPHYDEVEDAIVVLAQGYSARKQPIPDIDKLYEAAVWANPATREKLRTAETQSAELKRQTEAKRKAAAAKTAGSSITGAPGSGQMPADKSSARSLREELEAAAAEG